MPSIDESPAPGSAKGTSPDGLSPDTREPAPGAFIGRYQVVEKLATGGMGVVFRAYDPQLSRQVALELLLPSGLEPQRLDSVAEHEQRLLREARALASLSHPNVVAAYDVGRVKGELFIAMALIDGVSLREWLMQAPRPRAQVLRLLLDAGRGLAAAHRAGVVHRDFKLANVMVSATGLVQVVDFGLARVSPAIGVPSPDTSPIEPEAETSTRAAVAADVPNTELTRAGTIVGAIGYIAPELFEGHPSDERSDQFSYASAVYRALTSESPYPGDSLPSYRAALLSGARAPWPASIPRAVRRVIDRGLSRDPDARYPSLDALLDDLERAARPLARKLVLIAAMLALSVLAVSTAAHERFFDRCGLDAGGFEQTWNAERRDALESAFAASGNPRAASTFGLVDAHLADYRSRWQAAKHDACLATHQQRTQSEMVLDLRYACLDRKLAQLGSMLQLLQKPDAALVDRAPEALDSIAQLRDCSDVALLMGESDRMPDDPERRAQVGDLLERLDALEAAVATGRWTQSIELGEVLAGEADRAEYRPVQARAMARALQALERLGRRDEADVLRSRTLEIAAEARVHDVIAQLAVRSLLYAVDAARWQEAKALLPLVDANVRLAGRPPALQIRLLTYEAAIAGSERRYDAAIAKLELALTECQRLGNEGARSCLTPRRELGLVHDARDDYAAARPELEAAVEIAKRAYGPGHPSLLNEYNNLGYIAASWGDLDTAARAIAGSKALAASIPENRQTANIPYVEGMLLLRRGDIVAALPTLEVAVQRRAQAYGEETSQVSVTLGALSVCLASLGRMREAVTALERSRELRRALGMKPTPQLEATYRLADALWAAPALRSQALQRARVVHALLTAAGPTWRDDAQSVKIWLDTRGAEAAR